MGEFAFEPNPVNPAPIDENEVERIRSEVFIQTYPGWPPETERSFIRDLLTVRDAAKKEGIPPRSAWHFLELVSAREILESLRTEFDRENYMIVRARAIKAILSEDTEGKPAAE